MWLDKGAKASDPSEALDLFAQARSEYHAAGDRAGEAKAIMGEANACKRQGNTKAYVSHLKAYLALVGEQNLSEQAKGT